MVDKRSPGEGYADLDGKGLKMEAQESSRKVNIKTYNNLFGGRSFSLNFPQGELIVYASSGFVH